MCCGPFSAKGSACTPESCVCRIGCGVGPRLRDSFIATKRVSADLLVHDTISQLHKSALDVDFEFKAENAAKEILSYTVERLHSQGQEQLDKRDTSKGRGVA